MGRTSETKKRDFLFPKVAFLESSCFFASKVLVRDFLVRWSFGRCYWSEKGAKDFDNDGPR